MDDPGNEPDNRPEDGNEKEALDGFAPWDGRRVPVTLLGGYLGAGKTTAINELLARTTRPIAVLVNDVGAVNIDASLIARRHGDTIELTDGCVCCSLGQDLAEAFEAIRNRPTPPEHVVLELSGVADPARVIPWTRSDGFQLDGVIVMIDTDRFLDWIDAPSISTTMTTQLMAADLFLLTKTDLVTERRVDEVAAKLDELVPGVPALASNNPMAAASFLNLGTRQGARFTSLPDPSLFDTHTTSIIAVPDPVELSTVETLLDGLDVAAIRAKAIVRTPDGVSHLVHQVGRRRMITPLPDAESQPTTDLVVISSAQ